MRIVALFKIPLGVQKFEYKKKSYVVDLKKGLFDKKKNVEINWKVGQSDPLTFFESKAKLPSETQNTILENNFLQDIFSGGVNKNYIFMIIALIIAVVCIAVFSIYTQANLLEKIALLLNPPVNPPPIIVD